MTHWAGEYPDELIRAFFAQFTMEASLWISTKPRALTPLIAFLAADFQIPPYCVQQVDSATELQMLEFTFEFTSHVRDQVIHGACPIYPNHLKL